jgi:hypothetical protein
MAGHAAQEHLPRTTWTAREAQEWQDDIVRRTQRLEELQAAARAGDLSARAALPEWVRTEMAGADSDPWLARLRRPAATAPAAGNMSPETSGRPPTLRERQTARLAHLTGDGALGDLELEFPEQGLRMTDAERAAWHAMATQRVIDHRIELDDLLAAMRGFPPPQGPEGEDRQRGGPGKGPGKGKDKGK